MAQDIEARGGEMEGDDEGVLTRVCVTCGKEYFFADSEPPEGMSCERCGSTIFRSFYTPDEDDEASQEFEDSTARDLDPDDAEGDTLPGDVMDLDSR
jgi:DNA-directed RNA polymerase subunit RPC12/RpoP